MSDLPGTPQTSSVASESDNSSQRMINAGREIGPLKKLGRKVIVKELTMESVIRCSSELATVLATIDFAAMQETPALVLMAVLKDAAMARAIRTFAAESTQTSVDDWENAPVSDWMKFIGAAKDVNDFEELKQLFMAVGLDRIFRPQVASPVAISPTPQANA